MKKKNRLKWRNAQLGNNKMQIKIRVMFVRWKIANATKIKMD